MVLAVSAIQPPPACFYVDLSDVDAHLNAIRGASLDAAALLFGSQLKPLDFKIDPELSSQIYAR
jgi:hypothetical protein